MANHETATQLKITLLPPPHLHALLSAGSFPSHPPLHLASNHYHYLNVAFIIFFKKHSLFLLFSLEFDHASTNHMLFSFACFLNSI